MEEHGKKRLATAGIAFAGILYFFICALPLPKELVLTPVWARSVASAPSSPSPSRQKTASALPFRLGDRFGYFDPKGEILFASKVVYDVAVSKTAYASYDRLSESFAIRSPEGKELSKVAAPGYPFFKAGRRFILGPDQASVGELDSGGAIKWSYEFPSIVTAFDASPSLAVFGLMDGRIIGLDANGASQLDVSPGGSRVPGTYGVAVSPDGNLVAAISGLDKQRLVVFEKRSTAYRVTYHRWLDSDYRRPVSIAFTPDGSQLVFERPDGAGLYDRASRKESFIETSTVISLGFALPSSSIIVLLAGAGEEKKLIYAAKPDRKLLEASLRAQETFIELDGRSLFLGADGHLVRMDLREE